MVRQQRSSKTTLSFNHRNGDIKIVTKNHEETIPVVSNQAIAKEIKSVVSTYMFCVKKIDPNSSFNVEEQKQYAF